METMEKANIDWSNLGFGYYKTEKRFVSNFKDGKWDEGALTSDENVVINESAGVLQYAQTCFEGLKAYTTTAWPRSGFYSQDSMKAELLTKFIRIFSLL